MFVTLGDASRPLRGDYLLSAEQRFGLEPIPSTLVLIVRSDETVGQQLAVGALIMAGTSQDRYRVVKVVRAPSMSSHGGTGVVEALEVTAILDAVHAMALPASRAVIRRGTSFADIFAACGSSASVAVNVPVERFSCLVGQIQTIGIAQAMQEEAAVPVWGVDRAIRFVRLLDIVAGKPQQFIPSQVTRLVSSSFLEQHEIPAAMSVAPDGSIIFGRLQPARGSVFLPGASQRILRNMSVAMTASRTAQVAYSGRIRAGDVFDIGGQPHAAITVVHAWSSGNDGDSQQVTRMWLGRVSQ